MAFSQATMAHVNELAATAENCYAFGATPKGFAWADLFKLLLGLTGLCPAAKNEESREKLINQTASKVAMNGVAGCIECLGAKAAKKLRNKMARRLKVKSSLAQDKLLYTAVMAAAHNKDPAINAMDSAYSQDEQDEDD